VVDPSLAGNTILIGVTYGNSTSSVPTVTDDQGNTYSHCASEGHDSTNNRWVDVFYALGAATGTRNVTITWSTGVTHAQASVAQFHNVNAFDVCAGNGSGTAGTTFTSGSITTTASNDLLYTFAVATNPATNTGSFTAGSQSGITWNLLGPDRRDGSVGQFGTLSSAGTINPQLTISSSSAFAAVTVAMKSASTGTAPSGMYIACMQSYNSATASAGPYSNQIACPAGNLLVAEMNGGVVAVNSITDSNNTWLSCGANVGNGTGNPTVSGWFVPNANLPNENMSVSTSGTGDMSVWFYSVAGAATNQICSHITENNLSPGWSAPNMTPFSSLNGAVSSGLSFISMGQRFNTAIAMSSPSGWMFDAATNGGEDRDGPYPVDENNVRAHGPANQTVSTWTVTETDSATAPDLTAGEVDSFLAPSATGVGLVQPPVSNFGTSASSLTLSITVKYSGDMLIVGTGVFNGSTGRTVSKICLDGTTCAAGNAFTQVTGAASAASSNEANTDVWYLAGASAGAKTITVTFSGSSTNVEGAAYEVMGVTTPDTAAHINNVAFSSSTDIGASVTVAGSPEFILGIITTSFSIADNPAAGNEFNAGGVIYGNTKDAINCVITSTTGLHQPVWTDQGATGTNNGSTVAFK